MNKSIIGAVFSIGGLLLFSTVLVTSAIIGTALDGWAEASKLWFILFDSDEWGLSFLFFFAIALFLFGVVLLFWEQLKKIFEMKI